jgi:hypothetical protein
MRKTNKLIKDIRNEVQETREQLRFLENKVGILLSNVHWIRGDLCFLRSDIDQLLDAVPIDDSEVGKAVQNRSNTSIDEVVGRKDLFLPGISQRLDSIESILCSIREDKQKVANR